MARDVSGEWTDLAAPWLRGVEAATEALRLRTGLPTAFATPNTVALDHKTMRLRNYSTQDSDVPVIVHAPFAGHDAVIADFHERQSLTGCLQHHASDRLFLAEWKSNCSS